MGRIGDQVEKWERDTEHGDYECRGWLSHLLHSRRMIDKIIELQGGQPSTPRAIEQAFGYAIGSLVHAAVKYGCFAEKEVEHPKICDCGCDVFNFDDKVYTCVDCNKTHGV